MARFSQLLRRTGTAAIVLLLPTGAVGFARLVADPEKPGATIWLALIVALGWARRASAG